MIYRLLATDTSPFWIGRSPHCQLRLPDPLVSRTHAKITREGFNWILEDYQSTTGTFCAEERITKTYLRGGECVRMGMQILHLQLLDNELRILVPKTRRAGKLLSVPPGGIVLGRHILQHPLAARNMLHIRHQDGGGFILNACANWHSPELFRKNLPLEIGQRLELHTCALEVQPQGLWMEPGCFGLPLDARGISLKKHGQVLLKNVSFHVQAGELVAVVGLSGQGKSSLLKVLAGIWTPDSGKTTLGGIEILHPCLQRRTVFLQQDTPLPPLQTVLEILQDSAKIRLPFDSNLQEQVSAVQTVMNLLEITHLQQRLICNLSGGERKRCALACELLAKPAVLLLDEPTSGLDPAAERLLQAILRQIAWLGHTVIITTHNWNVFSHADKILIMHQGHLIISGRPSEVLEHFSASIPEEIPDSLQQGKIPPAPEMQSSDTAKERSILLPAIKRPWHKYGSLTLAMARRNYHGFFRDRGRLVGALIQPVLLGFLLRQILEAGGSAWLVAFALLLCALWFSLSATIREIVGDRPFLAGEIRQGLPATAIFGGKLCLALPLAWLQSLLVWLIISNIPNLSPDMLWLASVIAIICFSGGTLGLLTSTIATSQNQAVSALPMLVIPQVIFAGALVPLDRMTPIGYWVARLMPSSWLQSCLQNVLLSQICNFANFILPLAASLLFSIFAITHLRFRPQG